VVFFNEIDFVSSFQNTGVGMSQSTVDKLFVKNDESIFGTKKEMGIGIGLML
jgi:hypothetical protein